MTEAKIGTAFGAALRGLVYASGFVLLWWWVVALARPLDTRIALSFPEWVRLPGLAIAILGASVALWCIGAFALVGLGTPAPFDAPREFVAVGPYRYVRNPMYLGAAAVIVGSGLVLRSPAAVAVALFFVSPTSSSWCTRSRLSQVDLARATFATRPP